MARIPDSRSTKDIDFATVSRDSADSALGALNALIARDMGDYLTFKLTKYEESVDENGYSRLLELRYATFLAHDEKDPILIDLSLDCSTTLPPERIEPANRIPVEGIETCDYLVYPLPDQLADKLCAIMETQPGGWASSRMKDLVDVVAYATHEQFSLSELSYAIHAECAKRDMPVPQSFAAPESWRQRFDSFARKNGVGAEYASFDAASSLASAFFDPALRGKMDTEMTWNPDKHGWEPETQDKEAN